MDQVIAAANITAANTHFVINNVIYAHDGKQIFGWNGTAWVVYVPPTTAPAAPTPENKGNMNTFCSGYVMGHLGADPEYRNATTTGKLCCNFNLAVNNAGDAKPTWLHVCAFGKAAEAQRGILKKGSWVLVHFHRVKGTEWTDQQGVVRYGMDFHTKDIRWLFKKESNNAYTAAPTVPAQAAAMAQPTFNNAGNPMLFAQPTMAPAQPAQFVAPGGSPYTGM